MSEQQASLCNMYESVGQRRVATRCAVGGEVLLRGAQAQQRPRTLVGVLLLLGQHRGLWRECVRPVSKQATLRSKQAILRSKRAPGESACASANFLAAASYFPAA